MSKLALFGGKKAIEKGFEVHLATQVTSYSEEIKKYGILIHPIRISRNGINFLEILDSFEVDLNFY